MRTWRSAASGEAQLLEDPAAPRRLPSCRPCPYRRATITRFSRPVIISSTAADWPARPIMRRTAIGSRDHVVAGDGQGAVVGFEQRGDHADEGGLAGAVGPEDGHRLARGQGRSAPRGPWTFPKRLLRPSASIRACTGVPPFVVIGRSRGGPAPRTFPEWEPGRQEWPTLSGPPRAQVLVDQARGVMDGGRVLHHAAPVIRWGSRS